MKKHCCQLVGVSLLYSFQWWIYIKFLIWTLSRIHVLTSTRKDCSFFARYVHVESINLKKSHLVVFVTNLGFPILKTTNKKRYDQNRPFNSFFCIWVNNNSSIKTSHALFTPSTCSVLWSMNKCLVFTHNIIQARGYNSGQIIWTKPCNIHNYTTWQFAPVSSKHAQTDK